MLFTLFFLLFVNFPTLKYDCPIVNFVASLTQGQATCAAGRAVQLICENIEDFLNLLYNLTQLLSHFWLCIILNRDCRFWGIKSKQCELLHETTSTAAQKQTNSFYVHQHVTHKLNLWMSLLRFDAIISNDSFNR